MDNAAEARFMERINQLLDTKKTKQVDLANYLNVTKTTVSRYCAGRIPDAATLDRIAVFFDVTVDYLLGRTNDPQGKYIDDGTPADDLIYFLRGQELTRDDVEAVKDLLEARRLRREREQR